VGEHPSAARVFSQPGPDAFPVRQCFIRHVPFAVEEPGLKLPGSGVAADDFKAADGGRTDPAVSEMHCETATGRPFINVARHNRLCRSAAWSHRLTFGDPAADEYVQSIELRVWIAVIHGDPSAPCAFL